MGRRIIVFVILISLIIIITNCEMDFLDNLEERSQGIPDDKAGGVSFKDADYDLGELGGNIIITKAEDESNIKHYVLYWGSDDSTKLGEEITEIAKTGSNLNHPISQDTLIPGGATHFLVFTSNSNGEMAGGVSIKIIDLITKHTIDNEVGEPYSVYAADLDSDGDMDVLGASFCCIAWWENDGSENFTEHMIGDVEDARSVYAVDVDGDGDMDVLGTSAPDNVIAWWENDGTPEDGGWKKWTVVNNFTNACSVYAVDVDGDGDMDVLGSSGNGAIAWFENDGTPKIDPWPEHTIDVGAYYSVYAADVDGDGDMDVLGADRYTTDDIAWFENDGSQNFTKHTINDDFDGACSVYAVDVDGDGDIDVLGTAFYADEIAWWENDGSQNFTKYTIDDDFDCANSIYAADVDGDSDMDVLGAGGNEIAWWEF